MKLKVIMVSIFVMVYGLFFYINSQSQNKRIELSLEKQIKNLETHYAVTKDYFLTDATSLKSNVINNTKVLEILSKAQNATFEEKKVLRDELYTYLTPLYERIKTRGILQFQFVFPDNTSFLRMHKPSKYSDDLSDIRYSFKYANSIKKDIEGFEQGRTTHAFRYVFPLFDKQHNHLGAVEISLASYALQDKLLNVNKIHSHFLVSKNIFSVKAWETKHLIQKYIQSIESEDYMFALNDHANMNDLRRSNKYIMSHLKNKIKDKLSLKIPFAVYTELNNTMKVVTFLPIKNTQKKDIVAYLVSYTDNHNIYNAHRDFRILNIGIFIGMLFLFYFIYKNQNHKKELELEVLKKTSDLQHTSEKLQELNDNLEQKILIEVSKSNTIEKKLFQSEKMASMGDMIGNIAHQWRQPLSTISTAATGMQLQKECNCLDDKDFNEYCSSINNNVQYLSKTIDDFKNFIKGDRNKSIFEVEELISSFINLVESSIKSHNINIVLDLEKDLKIDSYENELKQCLMNIFNNAKDAFDENIIQHRLVFISTKQDNNHIFISIKDNAGGIPIDILPKIFEPYFTTKHQSQGTGLGLHMTYNLIVDGMNGNIETNNLNYKYQNKNYKGVEFNIILPIE